MPLFMLASLYLCQHPALYAISQLFMLASAPFLLACQHWHILWQPLKAALLTWVLMYWSIADDGWGLLRTVVDGCGQLGVRRRGQLQAQKYFSDMAAGKVTITSS
eukprot:3399434-Rhodomonas_salina.1